MKIKNLLFLPLIALLVTSCSSVKVTTDYDTKANFNEYKTFAFYKTGIDKATISDLDKKRIMRAIESELLAKGMTKSQTPDVLVSLFTKSRERVNVNSNNAGWGYGYGFGWNPWMYGGMNNNLNVSQHTEGTLFIDIIDGKKKELVWQGIGSGALRTKDVEKKEARIKEFVAEIMAKYPPGAEKK
ncbi:MULTISPECIES: DUF4136 domain-containing protein [Tenacibaculum]|uniref:DUF4136 domain-containing protein n=1 Tax=Tenacibaculum TaxID=104267 RepID=UPI001F0B6279|nr:MULTISPECIES: DUF4136 domain-containing protein [Tenacibaculum]MCH3882829.1 DUF4136 domain-containing protein [Tenacibaculum aquimarinum]MDO6600461.1 DUF4136 domain-containing protein [Tenacibaculum sp. 1_MG-2023]